MILHPDQQVQQPENETVHFGCPIHKCDWEMLYARARLKELEHTGMRYIVIMDDEPGMADASTGDAFDTVYYMRNDSDVNDRVCVLLRTNQGRDVCLESAAWIRIKENYPGMIYIVKAGADQVDKYDAMASTIGADQSCVCMVDFITIQPEDS